MTAVAVLVSDTLYQAGVLGQDQTPSSGDSQLVLRRLNRMLDSWSNEKQMIFANVSDSFVMTAGLRTYSTALLSGGRPIAVNAMRVNLNGLDYPVDMIDQQLWNSIGYKDVSSIPDSCFYDPTYPNGTFNFFPAPYGPFTCFVDAQRPLTAPLTLATDLLLPYGYEAAIVAALGVDICPSFGKQATPQMIEDRKQTRAVLKRNNYQPMEMVLPNMPGNSFGGGGVWGGDGYISGEISGVIATE